MSSIHSERVGVGETSKGRTSRAGHNLEQEKEQLKEKAEERAKKDALLEEKMKAIRKKNEELIKRQQEIEEDKRNADKLSDQVSKVTVDRTPAGVRTKRNDEPTGFGRARGRVLAKLSRERLKAAEWEEKKKKNIAKVEEEQRNPPKPSTSDFLHDDRRMDMSKVTGRTERSWGGHDFHNVRKQMERDRGLPNRSNADPEVHMTGKERQRYLEWKEERRKIDKERKERAERAKKAGDWSREWDRSKIYDPKKKGWTDADEFSAGSYSRNSRQEKSRLGDWMSPHDNWENDTVHNDCYKEESSHGWNERSVKHEPRNNQKEFRENKKGYFSSCKKEHRQTSGKWVKTVENKNNIGHLSKDQEENQSFVVPLTEDWGESTFEDTLNSAVDEHQEHTTFSGQMGETPLSETEEEVAEDSKEAGSLAEAEENRILPQEDTLTKHCENFTSNSPGDNELQAASSPSKTRGSNVQQNPQDSINKLQFDSVEKQVDKDKLVASLSSSNNAGTTVLSPALESAEKPLDHQSVDCSDDLSNTKLNANASYFSHTDSSDGDKPEIQRKGTQNDSDVTSQQNTKYCKKHPEPLDVCSAKRSSIQEETKQGPTTPDFLKPTYKDPNPKIDWGEYMEEIQEETN